MIAWSLTFSLVIILIIDNLPFLGLIDYDNLNKGKPFDIKGEILFIKRSNKAVNTETIVLESSLNAVFMDLFPLAFKYYKALSLLVALTLIFSNISVETEWLNMGTILVQILFNN